MPELTYDQKVALVRDLLATNPLNQATIAKVIFPPGKRSASTSRSSFSGKMTGAQGRRFSDLEIDRIIEHLRTVLNQLTDRLNGNDQTPATITSTRS
jgi:hypothetical protein